MTVKIESIKARLFNILEKEGWKRDRAGHYQKDIIFTGRDQKEVVRTCRMKFQRTSVRFEIKFNGEWIRRTGDYYSKVVFLENGCAKIGGKIIGIKNVLDK